MTPAKDSPAPAKLESTKKAGAKEDSKKAIKPRSRTKAKVSTQVTPTSQRKPAGKNLKQAPQTQQNIGTFFQSKPVDSPQTQAPDGLTVKDTDPSSAMDTKTGANTPERKIKIKAADRSPLKPPPGSNDSKRSKLEHPDDMQTDLLLAKEIQDNPNDPVPAGTPEDTSPNTSSLPISAAATPTDLPVSPGLEGTLAADMAAIQAMQDLDLEGPIADPLQPLTKEEEEQGFAIRTFHKEHVLVYNESRQVSQTWKAIHTNPAKSMSITGFTRPTKEEPEDLLDKKADLIYDILDEMLQEAHTPTVHSRTLAPNVLSDTLNEVVLPANQRRLDWNSSRRKDLTAKAIVTKACFSFGRTELPTYWKDTHLVIRQGDLVAVRFNTTTLLTLCLRRHTGNFHRYQASPKKATFSSNPVQVQSYDKNKAPASLSNKPGSATLPPPKEQTSKKPANPYSTKKVKAKVKQHIPHTVLPPYSASVATTDPEMKKAWIDVRFPPIPQTAFQNWAARTTFHTRQIHGFMLLCHQADPTSYIMGVTAHNEDQTKRFSDVKLHPPSEKPEDWTTSLIQNYKFGPTHDCKKPSRIRMAFKSPTFIEDVWTMIASQQENMWRFLSFEKSLIRNGR